MTLTYLIPLRELAVSVHTRSEGTGQIRLWPELQAHIRDDIHLQLLDLHLIVGHLQLPCPDHPPLLVEHLHLRPPWLQSLHHRPLKGGHRNICNSQSVLHQVCDAQQSLAVDQILALDAIRDVEPGVDVDQRLLEAQTASDREVLLPHAIFIEKLARLGQKAVVYATSESARTGLL